MTNNILNSNTQPLNSSPDRPRVSYPGEGKVNRKPAGNKHAKEDLFSGNVCQQRSQGTSTHLRDRLSGGEGRKREPATFHQQYQGQQQREIPRVNNQPVPATTTKTQEAITLHGRPSHAVDSSNKIWGTACRRTQPRHDFRERHKGPTRTQTGE